MVATEVFPGLYVGGMEDARHFAGVTIAVHEDAKSAEASDYHFPFMEGLRGDEGFVASRYMLEAVRHVARHYVKRGDPVLIHCGAGIERAPLAAVWYLHHWENMTVNAAYDLVCEKRPQVQRRKHWLDFRRV